jgi:hypothetical protein
MVLVRYGTVVNEILKVAVTNSDGSSPLIESVTQNDLPFVIRYCRSG